MPSFEIETYEVTVGISFEYSPNASSDGWAYPRIMVKPASSYEGPVPEIIIEFTDDTSNLGTKKDDTIVINLPLQKYPIIRRYLQTEAPVFISWEMIGNSSKVEYVSIGSTQDTEPVGEGLADADTLA